MEFVYIVVFLLGCCDLCQAILSNFNLPATITLDENQSARTLIFTVTADTDSTIQSFSMANHHHGAPFDINANTGEIDVLELPVLNYEAGILSFDMTVTIRDLDDTLIGVLTVDLVDVNEEPEFLNLPGVAEVFEEATTVTDIFTVTALDPEGEVLTYTCMAEPDDGNFDGSCDGDGVISHIAAQTFDVDTELTYVINVTVTDGTHEVSDQVTITVMNTHNDKPIFSNLPDTAGVREDRFPGWTIYTVSVIDPDGDDIENITFNRIEPIAGYDIFNFTLSGRVVLNRVIDYEVDPLQYIAFFNACDPLGLCTDEGNLTINIADENDPPVLSQFGPAYIFENQSSDYIATVGYNAYDPENRRLSYYMVDGYGDYLDFRVISTDGSVQVARSYDYEESEELQLFYLRVGVSDHLGLTDEANITLQVADVNEYPPVFQYSRYIGSVPENYDGTAMYIGYEDLDGGPLYGGVTVTIDNASVSELFQVSSGSTEARIITRDSFNREAMADPTFLFTVTATDGGGLTDHAEVELTVTDANEYAPVISRETGSILSVRTDESNARVGQVAATDRDLGGRPIIFTLVNGSSELFSVWYLDGTVSVAGQLEADQSYTVSVLATDSGTPPMSSESVSFTVCAYDPTEYLTDWEVNPGADDRLSNSEKRRIITRISAHCLCNAVLADTRQLDESTHWIMSIYLEDLATAASCPKTFKSKQEVMKTYTGKESGGDTNDIGGDMAVDDTEIVRIKESIDSPRNSWWLDTVPGIITIIVLCILGAIVLVTLLVMLFDYYWWMHRPEYRIFHNSVQKTSTPEEDHDQIISRQASISSIRRVPVMTSADDMQGALPGTPILERRM